MKTFTPRRLVAAVAAAAFGTILAAAVGPIATADDKGGKGNDFSAKLSGYNEVHFSGGSFKAPDQLTAGTLRGAISTNATGSFRLHIDEAAGKVHYELTYQDLTPLTADGKPSSVTQAHIHFGQRHTVGGITVWLCQTAVQPSPIPTTPVCPTTNPATVTGFFTEADVVAPAGQGIAAKDLNAVIRAIRAGATYANVHTTAFGPGEIRGQIRHGGGHGKGK